MIWQDWHIIFGNDSVYASAISDLRQTDISGNVNLHQNRKLIILGFA